MQISWEAKAGTFDCSGHATEAATQQLFAQIILESQSKANGKVGSNQVRFSQGLPLRKFWGNCEGSTTCTKLNDWMSHKISAKHVLLCCIAAKIRILLGCFPPQSELWFLYLSQQNLGCFWKQLVEMDCFCVLMRSSLPSGKRGSADVDCTAAHHI